MVGGEDLGRPGPGGDDGGVKNVEKEITLRERSTTDFSKEPLLTDNPHRFVILPIQYEDGGCTSRHRPVSGQPRKLTWKW
jgi:hypothetical protein